MPTSINLSSWRRRTCPGSRHGCQGWNGAFSTASAVKSPGPPASCAMRRTAISIRTPTGGGEEFLVVSGTFSDEHGDYEAGTYVRNPVGSSHKPYSKDGCIIFVKLWQMVPEDQEFVRIRTDTANWQNAQGGVSSLLLTERPEETVCMIDLTPGATYAIGPEAGGAEVLTLSGALSLDGAPMPEAAWGPFAKGPARRPDEPNRRALLPQDRPSCRDNRSARLSER